MAQYQILYWRDIPAQIKVFEGSKPVSRPLPESFQQAIDRVAMAEGLIGSDEYLNEWHTPKMERPGTHKKSLMRSCGKLKMSRGQPFRVSSEK
jgi:hypothetical protein